MELERTEEHLVYVIHSTNIVETKMKEVIAAFIKTPVDRVDFVQSFLLNNSIIPFGAKVKLVLSIAKSLSVKVNREAMHTLLSRRNAFAHQDHLNSVRVVENSRGYPDVGFVVEAVSGSGEFEEITHEKAFGDFVKALISVEADLDALLSSMGNSNYEA